MYGEKCQQKWKREEKRKKEKKGEYVVEIYTCFYIFIRGSIINKSVIRLILVALSYIISYQWLFFYFSYFLLYH